MIKLSGLAAFAAATLFCGVVRADSVTMGDATGNSSGTGSSSTAPTHPIVIPPNAVFTTPDINHVTHGTGAVLKAGAFTITVNTARGDAIAIDEGKGFVPQEQGVLVMNAGKLLETSTPAKLLFASGGTLTLITNGTAQLVGIVGPLTLAQSPLGFDYGAAVKPTAGALAKQFANNGGFFGILYNVHVKNNDILKNGFTANVKGDLAAIKGGTPPPPIPEPAMFSLVAMGLSGLFGAARRRVC
jgi:hypothetical protein